MKKLRKATAAGITAEILYFLSVAAFLVFHSGWALTLWELMTVIGAIAILIVMTVIADSSGIKSIYRTFMLISLSGTMFFTSAAHFTSIGVTRPLEAQGVNIPDFVKIGQFPGYEMTIDYIAWGLFMGCAFLCVSLGISEKVMKYLSGICCVLCLSGFIGSFFSESLWYIAPLGYGIGFLIMCIVVSKKHGAVSQG